MRAARLFFFGGSWSVLSSADGISLRLPESPSVRESSSILAAGVRGISVGRFDGTTGVIEGDTVGNATDEDEGVDKGVIIEPEFANGMEW